MPTKECPSNRKCAGARRDIEFNFDLIPHPHIIKDT